ncbi:ComEC family competence protein [Phyllobacterium sp. 21LDTY02-6]|uniref:ComEC/Rec2 family competence protein n=1 Tax=Phyllobacterium sp. 21LDTY02-6 TaxID=2944903 RepID=UPI002020A7BA|nr:ComEC/Rec2 family competence protein [Phyllobacterium sp. 21LDTY02-6]MCO4316516.1 ComEC family competence protein [Phyllobacterium sp. 21LDTY02-6]
MDKLADLIRSRHESGLAPPSSGNLPVPDTERRAARPAIARGMAAGLALAAERGRHAASVALRHEAARGTTFLLLPVFAGTGSVLYFTAAAEPRLSSAIFGLVLLGALRWMAADRPLLRLAVTFALALVAGMAFAKIETILANTPMLGSDVTTEVTGRVLTMARNAKGGVRVVLDVIDTAKPKLRFPPSRIAVSARKLPAGLGVGDGLGARIHLRSPSGPSRPDNYDFAFNNYYRGIGANGFVLGMAHRRILPPKPGLVAWALSSIESMRQRLTQHIQHRIPGEAGDIAASLITGQRDGISDKTNNALRLSGLSHILSISGFHMALVAVTIMATLRASLALFPGVAARYPVKKFAAATALAGSAFYLLLSGADVAAQRSFIMLSIMLLAVLVDRAALSMRNLALAAMVTIALAPHEIMGPSFQMSYSATAALIAFYGWWGSRRAKRRGRPAGAAGRALEAVAQYVIGIALTSLVAGAASSIFAAYHFNNTAPLGLIGNALALPVISTLVIPFGVIGLMAMPFDLDGFFFGIMERGIDMVIMVAEMVSGHSPPGNFGLVPRQSLILACLGLIILLFPATRLRLFALPLFAAAAALAVWTPPPEIMISENASLVALRATDGRLAVNRAGAESFTLKNWQQAHAASAVIVPAKPAVAAEDTQFECNAELCLAREPRYGAVVAHVRSAEAMAAACMESDIMVLAFAGPYRSCEVKNAPITVTRQQLALFGAATIKLRPAPEFQPMPAIKRSTEDRRQSTEPTRGAIAAAAPGFFASIEYAIGRPIRPWNNYRIHSRAARNIAERPRPPKRPPVQAVVSTAE